MSTAPADGAADSPCAQGGADSPVLTEATKSLEGGVCTTADGANPPVSIVATKSLDGRVCAAVRSGAAPGAGRSRRWVTVFTDGACSGNGRSHARASYAAIVLREAVKKYTLSGIVEPFCYRMNAAEEIIVDTSEKIMPSNNRGEMLAIIYAIDSLLDQQSLYSTVEIISDSELCVKTLTIWLPARIAKGTQHELKNGDLLNIAHCKLEKLRAMSNEVIFTHINSHRPAPPSSAPIRDRMLHRGNYEVDILATNTLHPANGAPANGAPTDSLCSQAAQDYFRVRTLVRARIDAQAPCAQAAQTRPATLE